MKAKRHMKIREIISTRDIDTQEELAEALREAGFHVTQATISRDIKELQLVKIQTAQGKYKYALPIDHRIYSTQKLKRALEDCFLSIESASHFVVMKTLPGNAHAIGALIDHLEWPEVMGTICGDDTILIICREAEKTKAVTERILQLM